MSEWNVYYDGAIWNCKGETNPGKEIPVNKDFVWGNEQWKVLSFYCCDEGLVIDLCKKVEIEEILSFIENWHYIWDSGQRAAEETMSKMTSESPFTDETYLSVKVNGISADYHPYRSENIVWDPTQIFPGTDSHKEKAFTLVEHYDLDTTIGWEFCRIASAWQENSKKDLREIELTIHAEAMNIAGIHFKIEHPGQEIFFTHPVTKEKYTLVVNGYIQEILNCENFDNENEGTEYYILLTYSTTPDLSDKKLTLIDCSQGNGSALIGYEEEEGESCYFTFSSLYSTPPKDIEWQMIFHEKLKDDITVTLQSGRDFDII